MIKKLLYFFIMGFCCLSITCKSKNYLSFYKEQDILLFSSVLLQYDFHQAKSNSNEFVLYERYKVHPNEPSSLYGFREINRIEIPEEVRNKEYFKKLIYIEKRENVLYYVETRSISGLNRGVLFTPNGMLDISGLQILKNLRGSDWNRIMYFESY